MPRWTEELGAFALDLDGNVTLASPLAEEISGIDLTALLDQHFLAFISPADRSDAQAVFDKAVQGHKVEGVRQIVVAGGAELTVGYTIQPDREEHGTIVGVTGTVWMEKPGP